MTTDQGERGFVVAQTFTALTVDAPTALSNLGNEKFPIAVMCLHGSKQDVTMQIQKVRSLTRTSHRKPLYHFCAWFDDIRSVKGQHQDKDPEIADALY